MASFNLIDEDDKGRSNETVKKMVRAYNLTPNKFWIGDIVYYTSETKGNVVDKYGLGYWDERCIRFNIEPMTPIEIVAINKHNAETSPWWYLTKIKGVSENVWFIEDGLIHAKPNYSPKKINRTLEAHNNMGEANEIMILLRNIDELNTLYEVIKPLGYVLLDPFFRLMRESNSPINIFINLQNGDITQSTHMKSHGNWTENSTFDGVWEKELTIEDLPLIKKILQNKKIMIEPSYKPRIIKRIDEEVFIPYYIPKVPPTLTPKEQEELYKIGEIVIVRPDAFEYFKDVDSLAMRHYFGKKVKIIKLTTAKEHYGDDEDSDLVKSSDLLVTVISADESYRSRAEWYWHYKCLFDPKTIKPSYIPRKVDRTLESVYIDFSHIPSPILSPFQQSLQYKIGDTVIIRPDAFDYFYDVNESMRDSLRKSGKIINIVKAKDIYSDEDFISSEKGEGMTEEDLIITVRTYEVDDEDWYWFYRCLINPKFIVPSYKPKKMFKDIEEIEESFRDDYYIIPEKYQEKFGKISSSIIPIEEIEQFYDVKFEDYCNDLYPKSNQ